MKKNMDSNESNEIFHTKTCAKIHRSGAFSAAKQIRTTLREVDLEINKKWRTARITDMW